VALRGRSRRAWARRRAAVLMAAWSASIMLVKEGGGVGDVRGGCDEDGMVELGGGREDEDGSMN
jgi:hypothetical protein